MSTNVLIVLAVIVFVLYWLITSENRLDYRYGTTRIVRRFVIRKKIDGEVKWFQICSWEEKWSVISRGDDMGPGKDGFVGSRFFRDSEYWEVSRTYGGKIST